MGDWSHKSEGPPTWPFTMGFGLFLIMFVLICIMFVLKCCVGDRNARGLWSTTKVTRRRRLRNNSYQNIHQQSMAPSAVTVPLAPSSHTVVDGYGEMGIDDIVVVSDPNTIEASPVVVPPYPVEPRHPTPHAAAPAPGFATHNPPYPTHTPHPVPGAAPYPPSGPTPYPAGAIPYPGGAAPYPPAGPPVGGTAPYLDYGALPPTYSEAVSQPPVQPLPTKDGYSKQAPYNPNY